MTVLPVTSAQTGNTDLVQVLSIRTKEIQLAFFCSNCLLKFVDALTLYQTYHKFGSELDVQWRSQKFLIGEADFAIVLLSDCSIRVS